MKKEAVLHVNTEEFVYPVSRQKLIFRIRMAKKEVKQCILVYWDRTRPNAKKRIEMECCQRDALFDYMQCSVTFSQIARYQKYYFEIQDVENTFWYYCANGLCESIPDDGFFEYLYANGTDVVHVPEWAKGAVYYQIFPERFCNGDKTNDPQECMNWGTLPTRENYMGGDLKGIISKLPYLQSLGIECIYLNPIFEGDFNHKYATTNYYEIDPIFGTKETFKELVAKCHEKHIKVVLDGVFNHTGVHFKQFQDVVENQEKSKYADWFYIKKFPFEFSHHDYECVGAYKWMPKLNTANPQVRDFILNVMEYWVNEYHIDGWRLDVADEVDPAVWEEARLRLKDKCSDVVLIGETWGYGGKMLRGNQMDSVMNYMFRDIVRDYFAKGIITAEEFDNRINHMLASHKDSTNLVMFNLIDSHDTERFLFLSDENKELQRLAVAFQMLFPGAPAIYYGDEVAMTGDNDPDCRRCMTWDEDADEMMLEWYRELILIHKSFRCIRTGNYRTIVVDNKTDSYAFVRYDEQDAVYVVIHKGNGEVTLEIPLIDAHENYVELLSKEKVVSECVGEKLFYNGDITDYKAEIRVKMEPYSVKVICKN